VSATSANLLAAALLVTAAAVPAASESTDGACPASGSSRLAVTRGELERRAAASARDEDPGCATLGLALADVLDRPGREACSAADRVAAARGRDASSDLLAFQAALSWRCGRPKEAWSTARAAIAADGESTLAWTVLGRILSSRFRPRAARAAFQRALALDPRETGALLALSRIAETRAESRALLARYLDAAAERGEPPERVRAARETLAFLESLGERPIWIVEKAELPGLIPLEPYVVRPGQINGLIVRLALGEKVTVPALFDSGASGLHLADNAARKVEIEPVSDGTLVGGGGDKEHAVERAIVPRLEIGPVEFSDALGVVAEGSLHPQGVYRAIVGIDVLGGTRITLDAGARRALVEDAPAVDDGDDALSIDPWPKPPLLPLVEVEGQLLVPATIAAPSGSATGLALLDTGASRSLASLSAAEEVAALAQRGQRGAAAYGGQVVYAGVLPVVRAIVGSHVEDLKEVGVIDLSDRARHAGVGLIGFIGLDLLTHAVIEIDLASGTVVLADTPAGGRAR